MDPGSASPSEQSIVTPRSTSAPPPQVPLPFDTFGFRDIRCEPGYEGFYRAVSGVVHGERLPPPIESPFLINTGGQRSRTKSIDEFLSQSPGKVLGIRKTVEDPDDDDVEPSPSPLGKNEFLAPGGFGFGDPALYPSSQPPMGAPPMQFGAPPPHDSRAQRPPMQFPSSPPMPQMPRMAPPPVRVPFPGQAPPVQPAAPPPTTAPPQRRSSPPPGLTRPAAPRAVPPQQQQAPPPHPLEVSRPPQKPKIVRKPLPADTSVFATATPDVFRGHVVSLCFDQAGCRVLQNRLSGSDIPADLVGIVFEEILESAVDVMKDGYGNYLFQRIITLVTPQNRIAIVNAVLDSLVDSSLDLHGTRSVQRLIEVCEDPVQVRNVFLALKPHIVSLSRNSNGNHVIQRCLQYFPQAVKEAVIEEVMGQLLFVAQHRHGCCVVQRCLDVCSARQRKEMLHKLLSHALELIQDPFANYVIQYVLKTGSSFPEVVRGELPHPSDVVGELVLRNIVPLSKQKFSSNVVEKVLDCGSQQLLSAVVQAACATPGAISELTRDQFGNYVVQRLIGRCDTKQGPALCRAVEAALLEGPLQPWMRKVYTRLSELAKRHGIEIAPSLGTPEMFGGPPEPPATRGPRGGRRPDQSRYRSSRGRRR